MYATAAAETMADTRGMEWLREDIVLYLTGEMTDVINRHTGQTWGGYRRRHLGERGLLIIHTVDGQPGLRMCWYSYRDGTDDVPGMAALHTSAGDYEITDGPELIMTTDSTVYTISPCLDEELLAWGGKMCAAIFLAQVRDRIARYRRRILDYLQDDTMDPSAEVLIYRLAAEIDLPTDCLDCEDVDEMAIAWLATDGEIIEALISAGYLDYEEYDIDIDDIDIDPDGQ